MLPAVYCDYLLALYSNGDEFIEKEMKSGKNNVSIIQLSQLLLVCVSTCCDFGYVYILISRLYTDWSITPFYPLFILALQGVKAETRLLLSFVIFLLLVFLTTILLSNTYFYPITPYIMIMNFVIWFVIGRKMESIYLLIASTFGILLMVPFNLFYN